MHVNEIMPVSFKNGGVLFPSVKSCEGNFEEMTTV